MIEPVLEFTGERFTPECVREIWYEHMHRYAFAQAFARGRRVLDAACGEGYGSAMLAEVAASVQGVDVSAQAIGHARARYADRRNLEFRVDDVTALQGLPAARFDLIVSFETLEHVEAQEAMLDGFGRLLAPGGLLLVSTPDRHVYSEMAGFRNEYHVRELYQHEFEAMLGERFTQVRLFAQRLLFQSVLWSPERQQRWAAHTQGDSGLLSGLGYPPMYWLAACSQDPAALRDLPDLHLFGDAAESVYQHYNHEVRKNMAAGQRILELEREVAELNSRLARIAASPTG